MSETKFTKGEWLSFYPHEILNSGHVSVESEDGRQICISEVHKSDLVEKTANMRLISKSPKMYEMLVAVRNELYQLIDEVNDQRASKITSTTENEPCYHDHDTLHLIDNLLAEVRGEL